MGKRLRPHVLTALFAFLVPAQNQAATLFPSSSKQLVIVVGSGFSPEARLLFCERGKKGWELVLGPFPAVIGKNGMAWGGGSLEPSLRGDMIEKKEGDLRAPSGLFRLGPAMGYADKLPFTTSFAYRTLLTSHQGVDDIRSKYYNRIVDVQGMDPSEIDWKSFEIMRRKDDLYKWLLVIGHNEKNVPGKGSMTFLHVWRAQGKGTAGCSALAEQDLLGVLGRLDPGKDPLILQVPEAMYGAFQKEQGLPPLERGH